MSSGGEGAPDQVDLILDDDWVLAGAGLAPARDALPTLSLEVAVDHWPSAGGEAAEEEQPRTRLSAVLSAVAAQADSTSRAPLRLVAVLDKSGSMRGEKLELVTKTMQLMLKHLRQRDALGIVEYDSDVKVLAPLTRCDAEGRTSLDASLKRLRAGTQTNLSGGLLKGLELHTCAVRSTAAAPSSSGGSLQRVRFGNTYRRMSDQEAQGPEHLGRGPPPEGAKRVHEWAMEFRCESPEDAALVHHVTYRLHETFAEPVVEVHEGPLFRLKRFGWGTFRVKADVHLQDGRTLALKHDLTFGQPEDFRTLLLPLRRDAAPASGPPDCPEAEGRQLDGEGEEEDQGVVRSTFLFTDGLANQGITDPGKLCAAAEAVLGELKSRRSALSTFGFGKDHSADLLGRLAAVGGGIYSYIEDEDQIGQAFGEAIGGLLSTTHQNVRLTLALAPGVRLARACTNYPVEDGTSAVSIDLGDLFAEERRDILVELEVPLGDSKEPWPRSLGHLGARAFSVLHMRFEDAVRQELLVLRLADGGEGGAAPCVPQVERHRCRYRATTALRTAQASAKAGRLDEARRGLEEAAEAISASPLAVQGDALCLALIADLRDCLKDMRHQAEYRSIGSKKMLNLEMGHGQQRSANTKSLECYTNTMQMTMKSAFKEHTST